MKRENAIGNFTEQLSPSDRERLRWFAKDGANPAFGTGVALFCGQKSSAALARELEEHFPIECIDASGTDDARTAGAISRAVSGGRWALVETGGLVSGALYALIRAFADERAFWCGGSRTEAAPRARLLVCLPERDGEPSPDLAGLAPVADLVFDLTPLAVQQGVFGKEVR